MVHNRHIEICGEFLHAKRPPYQEVVPDIKLEFIIKANIMWIWFIEGGLLKGGYKLKFYWIFC